jgi:hypothetical protein
MTCDHILKAFNIPICPLCGKATHDPDWNTLNKAAEQWRLDNPDAKYEGWMSI